MSNTAIPPTFRKYVVHQLSTDFDKATKLETINTNDALKSLKPKYVAIKQKYWAINASDINFTAGRYDPTKKPPFDCGFEAVGEVIAVGTEVKNLKVGQAVAVMQYGTFAEVQFLPEQMVIPIPSPDPTVLALLVSGITSHLSLKHHGLMKSGETVLVTAAAGGAGQIAVQLAKAAGNHVIGTCSSEQKVQMLKKFGCDRVINYKTEDVKDVLKREYPNGVDIVYEGVGGEMLKTCLGALAVRGRLIVIGSISNYSKESEGGNTGFAFGTDAVSTASLLSKSTTVTGFFLGNYMHEIPSALNDLFGLVKAGKLQPLIEMADFEGITDIPRAIKYMHEGKNIGKLVVPASRSDHKL
ncbi:NADPH:quinone reductase [Gaertneriomyces semiglobifer]|nr:NADPH:quinone reductase [Gaertneriomyces semiglobifer]